MKIFCVSQCSVSDSKFLWVVIELFPYISALAKLFQMQLCSSGSVDVARADVVSIVPSLTLLRCGNL